MILSAEQSVLWVEMHMHVLHIYIYIATYMESKLWNIH